MFRQSIFSMAICIVVIHEIFGDQRQAETSIFQINHRKPIYIVSDKFLSFTVDPTTLSHVADCQLTNATLSLMKKLLPAYLRVAGSNSNRLLFESSSDEEFSSDSSASSSKSENLILSENQWSKFYEFVSSTGMNLVVCLSDGIFNEQTNRDLNNTLEFITFSNKNNFHVNWQLGYELQNSSQDDGKATGLDIAKLRKILNVFPRYQNSLIVGPDVTNFDREDIIFLRNYLFHAQDSLNVFTIQPNFTSIADTDLHDSLSDIFAKMDTYLWLRDEIVETALKGVVPKKPIWIAESENKDLECKFSDSMSMIKRLGFAAKLGASVYLRQPHLLSIYEPTSEFWAASLFKALVGRSVLDAGLTSGNNSSVVVFSHCTQILEKPEENINPTVAYERGSITAYGVNSESEPVRLSLKTGIKTDETVHMYVLTEDSRNRIGKTLLNRQHLDLSEQNDLPMLSPRIRESAESVVVPARSIFFFVFPNIRCRACMQQLVEGNQEVAKMKVRSSISNEEKYTTNLEELLNLPKILKEPEDESAMYSSYPDRSERIKAAHEHLSKINEVPEEKKHLRLDSPAVGPKYSTFSENTLLSSSPEKFMEIDQPSSSQSSQFKKERHSKMEKYRILAQAFAGQRIVTAESSTHSEEGVNVDLEDNKEVEGPVKRLMRFRRSEASLPSNFLSMQTTDGSRYASVPYYPPIADDLEESNNNLHDSLLESRERRDINGDDSLMLKDSSGEVNRIFEEFSDPNHASHPTTEKSIPNGSTVNKINPVVESHGLMNMRQNRQIEGKSVVPLANLASDSNTVLEDSVATHLGPVNPFPRHHTVPIKTKSKTFEIKKIGKSLDLHQDKSSESSSSEPNLEMSDEKSTVQSADTKKDRAADNAEMNSSEIPVESQNTSLSLNSTTLLEMENSNDSAKNVPSAASKARNADVPVNHEIRPKYTTNEHTASKSVPHLLDSVTHKNQARAHLSLPIHQNAAPVHPTIRTPTKDLMPSNHIDDFTKKLKEDTSMLRTPIDPSQIIDLARARIQELLNVHKARMEETQRKIQEATANKRQEGKNSNHSRNKRETTDSAPAAEPKNSSDQGNSDADVAASARQVHPQRGHASYLHENTEAPSRAAPSHLHGSTEAPSKVAPTYLHRSIEDLKIAPTHLRRSTKTPAKTTPTFPRRSTVAPSRTTPVPRRKKPTRKPSRVPRKNVHDLRPLADIKHKARLHESKGNPIVLDDSKLNSHQLQKRDLINNVYSELKHVYDDISSKVQKNMAPVEKWVEERADEVKHELNELRLKRDLQGLKEKFRGRKEKLRQKLAEMLQQNQLRKRDAGGHHHEPRLHFDEKIMDYKNHLHHTADIIKKMKQDHERSKEHKIAELSKHKSEISSNFIIPDRNRFVRSAVSDNSFEQDKEESEIIFTVDSVASSNEFNESSIDNTSVDNSGPQIPGNSSDTLSPPEKKSELSNESQCNDTNFLSNIWCGTKSIFSSLFSSI